MRRDEAAAHHRHRVEGLRALISFPTREEVLFWAILDGWGPRRMNDLEQHLDDYELVEPSAGLVDISARLRFERERVGRKPGTADTWIAATASRLGCPSTSSSLPMAWSCAR